MQVPVPKPQIDLSFSRYVEARKSEVSARYREGAAYAYSGDLKVRAALDKIRPVTLAVEATVRLWQQMEKSRMLGAAVRVTERQFPKVHAVTVRCAEALRIPPPTLYVSPGFGGRHSHTFGTSDEPYVMINAALIDQLSEAELAFVIGHECGHIQNNHVVYMTTLFFLTRAANMFLRWSVKPAVLALNAWARRAEVTCDRTGIICTKDLDSAITTLVKMYVGSQRLYSDIDVDEYLAQLEENRRGGGRINELEQTFPYLPRRVEALKLFAQTTYYRSLLGTAADAENPGGPPAGIPKEECDAKVSELLAVLR